MLSSLKKADEQNQKPAETAETPAAAPSLAVAESAPAAAAATPAPFEVGGGIDFDNVASGDGAKKKDGENLVSASRVFRAGEKSDSGGGRRLAVGLIALILVVGGGAGVVVSGLLPGVSVGSIARLVGVGEQAPQVVQRQSTAPVLEALGGDDAALSLPRPLVDVQSDITEFAGFRGDDGTLDTPQGRQELAEQIVGFVEEAAEDDFIPEDDLQIIGLELDEESVLPEEEAAAEEVVKTAELSRDVKLSLDARTPSDRTLSRAVTRKAAEEEEIIVIAQASEESAEDSADSADSAGPVDSAADESADKEIKVKPSLKGVDRRRMLNEAARLYSSGAYVAAEAVYRNILFQSATNLDALRGLALVAVATGRYQLAVATYLKILEYYPNDPVAVADLTNLHGVSGENFYAVESALKKVIGEHPEWDSRLYFALGNLYAGAERWLDAQKAYFNAYSGEQTNPDYAYNLAVVLDYLNKPRIALTYYREALELAARTPGGFDADRVRARIADISQ